MEQKLYYVYIMASPNNKALYTGVTGDLIQRAFTHKAKIVKGFTKRYNISKLVYYEATDNIQAALEMEKRIKAGSRKKKEELINGMNPKWDDLYGKLL
jgi:putative endonuclease